MDIHKIIIAFKIIIHEVMLFALIPGHFRAERQCTIILYKQNLVAQELHPNLPFFSLPVQFINLEV